MGKGAGRRLPSLSAPKAISIRPMPVLDGPLVRGRRAVSAMVSIALRTIHPNPGPFGRDKSEEAKARRRKWRKAKRKEKRDARARLAANNTDAAGPAQEKTKMVVATWNVQQMSLSSRRRWKLREVAEYARRSGMRCC